MAADATGAQIRFAQLRGALFTVSFAVTWNQNTRHSAGNDRHRGFARTRKSRN
jgi:hypothetical protein